jgi:hypothetical protein
MSSAAERTRRSRQQRKEGLRSWDIDLPDTASENLLDALMFYGRLTEAEAADDDAAKTGLTGRERPMEFASASDASSNAHDETEGHCIAVSVHVPLRLTLSALRPKHRRALYSLKLPRPKQSGGNLGGDFPGGFARCFTSPCNRA